MEQKNLQNKTIFHADNMDVLKGINSATVDLIYLDPPFGKHDTFIAPDNKKIGEIKQFFISRQNEGEFSGVDFERVFANDTVAFKDIWNKNDLTDFYYTELDNYNSDLVKYIESVQKSTMGGGFYYLIYMAVRLIEMKRILKDSGSLYLHCDPTMSHYLKALLDKIFDVANFRNEIIWCYRGAGYPKKDFGNRHDILFRYSKSDNYILNLNAVREEYAEATKKRFKHYIGNKRNGIDFGTQSLNPQGKHPDDWWQIQPIAPSAKERVGYPTQKPLALLERIIKASSNEGDIVLDPFCGCATTCIAAESLQRKWIGIDINEQAFYMIYYRAHKDLLLSTEYAPTLFKDEIFHRTTIPERTDLTHADRQAMREKSEKRAAIKQQKINRVRTKLSAEEKTIAKELLYEEQAGMCNGCDVYLRSVDLTIDHIIPQANANFDDEAMHDLNNLQLLCYRCNNWKRTSTMLALIEKLKTDNIISSGTHKKLFQKWSAYTP